MPVLDQQPTTPFRLPRWACLWYAITLGSWFASWGIESASSPSAAGLTVLVILTEAVSLALRWQSISGTGTARTSAGQSGAAGPGGAAMTTDEVTWLCAWGAQANALGFVAMLSSDLTGVLPGLLVTAAVEACLLRKAPLARRANSHRVARELGPPATSPAVDLPAASELAAPTPVLELEDERWTRSTHDGCTESGERYASGWVRFQLAADQKVQTLSIGFSPAFATVPEVEVDQEVDSQEDGDCEESHCEALVEHVTPAGMRVAIKRSSPGAALSGKMLWHAAESDCSATLRLSSRLP